MSNRFVVVLLILFSSCMAAQEEKLALELQSRRAALAQKMTPESVFILFSAPVRYLSRDIAYEYRQSSNFYYLTGITQPETILILFAGEEPREILFVQDPTRGMMAWSGELLTRREAGKISGISNVRYTRDFQSVLSEILNRRGPFCEANGLVGHPFMRALARGRATCYLELENRPGWKRGQTSEWELAQNLDRVRSIRWKNGFAMIADLRLHKSPWEVQCMERAAAITEEALHRAVAEAAPGKYEYEVEAALEYVYRKNGTDWAFPSIIASGPNSVILHYTSSRRRIQAGDLLLMDVGASYRYYGADITRTIPVSGRFTDPQREIYEIVLEAQQKGVEAVKPGADYNAVHQAAVDVIAHGLERLGLITEIDSPQYTLYYMHDTSHWLGLDTHDVGPFSATLEPGMVLTVEPGIYVAPDVLTLARSRYGDAFADRIAPQVNRYRNIGVRIEDDVLVTEIGYRILGGRLPKTIDAVEKWVQSSGN